MPGVYRLVLAQLGVSFALLHRFGVPQRLLNRLLVVEILLLAAVCVLPGIWLGRWLAAGLGSGFGQALEGLFDQPLYAGQGGSWLVPLVTMMAVILVACLADFLRPIFRGLVGGNRRYGGLVLLVLIAGLALAVWGLSLIPL